MCKAKWKRVVFGSRVFSSSLNCLLIRLLNIRKLWQMMLASVVLELLRVKLKELHGVRWIAFTDQVVSVGLIAVALLVVVAQAVGLPERLDVLLFLVRSLLREAIVASALHELLVVALPAGNADGLDQWQDLLFQAVGALCSQPLHRLKSLLQLEQEGVEAFV
jgi:hypothetical protein